MATTNNVTDNQAIYESLGLSRPAGSNGTGGKDMNSTDFMKLMLAQMQHQDPTNPADSSQYLTQIAQFSTVTGIQDMNKSMAGLSSSMQTSLQSSQALQASTLVGRTVLMPSTKGVIDAKNTTMSGTVDLPVSSSNVSVGIYTTAGVLVRAINLGTQPAGSVAFSWDGMDANKVPVKEGSYVVKAGAFIDGTETALPTNVYAQVQSVDLGGPQGIRLNLAGLGSADFSNIKQIK